NRRYYPEGVAGPAFSVQSLAEEVSVMGHDASVICLRTSECDIAEHNGVSIHRLSQTAEPDETIATVQQILSVERPDVVHTNWLNGFPAVQLGRLIRQTGTRLVHTVREYGFLCQNGTMYRPQTGPCQSVCEDCHSVVAALREFTQAVDAVVGVSRFCLNAHLQAGLFAETSQLVVVHNSFRGPAEPALGLPESRRLRLGFLGRIHPVKGIFWLLRKLSDSSLADGVHLTIAGNAPPDLPQRLASEFSNLHLECMGFASPSELMNRIDWLVTPSICHDALGRVVLEAFAFGVPVLGSRMGGIPEIIRHGENGRLFSPFEPGDVLKELTWILENRDQWPSYRAHAWTSRDAFTPEQIAAEYLRVYRGNG
ncbi:MAG: glycosyltransferase, partial [Planctomycetaceae bacterium]